jgi:EpsI family protein
MKTKLISWVAGVAMVCCAVLAQTWRPVAAAASDFQLEAAIPAEFSGWRVDPNVVPVAPTPDVQENLAKIYGQIVSRTYVNEAGQRMMLVVAYGGDQSDSLKAHRQEVCYEAQGFTVRQVHRDSLNLGGQAVPLVRMHAQKGNRSEPVSYWFTMGNKVVIDRVSRLVTQLRFGLARQIPDGLLFRVSNLSPNTSASFSAQDGFIQSLLAAVDSPSRLRLAGLAEANLRP